MSPIQDQPKRRSARLRFASGARRAEQLFLEEVDRYLDELGVGALENPPLRIVVPSRTLRAHVLARLVEHRGRAVAGVQCSTLFGLALETVERHDEVPRLHDELSLLFARRYATREDALQTSLGHLRDGFSAVDKSVRDLLEAGLDPAHVEALEEALSEDGTQSDASVEEVERAAALVRVAGRTLLTLEELGLHHTATLLRRATDLVRQNSSEAGLEAPLGGLVVHGFSDAIGVATDFLAALLDRYSGTLILTLPPDPAGLVEPGKPAEPALDDASKTFVTRFAERISDVAVTETPESRAQPAKLAMVQAVGAEAEAREIASRVRVLLDDGVRPERIAVVARRLEPYRTALRTHFGRLAVPFSAFGAAGPRGMDGRRAQALAQLLKLRGTTPVERWLDARESPVSHISDIDLHLALAAVGAGRLEEVSGRPYDSLAWKGQYALPVRSGFSTDDETVAARKRKVPIATLKEAALSAGKVCELLRTWSSSERLAEHVAAFQELLYGELGWNRSSDLSRQVTHLLDELTRGVPGELKVGFDEFVDLVSRPLEGLGALAFGGNGGGIQVLDITEARALTFEHLFVMGLNRGVFPRVVNEDPLLPDTLRAVLSRHGFGLLQDLPQKLDGYDEERYLFSQILSAAPNVTVSWLDVDDDNHQQTASPLVERLRWSATRSGDGRLEPETARHLYSVATASCQTGGWRHRPAHESAVLAGLHGDRAHFGRILRVALERVPAALLVKPPPRGLHSVRVRVLDELDPVRGTRSGEQAAGRLGPYFGFIGPVAPAGDPRSRERIFITALEGLTSCSWRTFLERLLQLGPVPDPLEALPAVEPLYIGNLVHRVLERIVARQLRTRSQTLEDARGAPTDVLWPEPEEFKRLLAEEADELVRQEGFAFPGFARLMAEVTRPYLEVAREVEWGRAKLVPAAATELLASLSVTDALDRDRDIYFKADRVDSSGALTVTDYKTGRPMSDKKTEAARRRHFLDKVRSGEALQAVAYALAGGSPDDSGRYVYLRPDPDIELAQRSAAVAASDSEFVEAFQEVVQIALEAWDRGAFFPRLIDARGDREFRFCASCRVAEACLRGDSGARSRLRNWIERRSEDPPVDADKAAVLGIWQLRDASDEREPWNFRR